MYADAYIGAGFALPAPEVSYNPISYYLTRHSIQLSLKAFLSLHDATMLKLSLNAFGHNLKAIAIAAGAKGLQRQSFSRIDIAKKFAKLSRITLARSLRTPQ